MPRKSGLFTIRKPRLTIGPKGIRITKPSMRIGRSAGINLSSRGASFSMRTKAGTINSRKGCSRALILAAITAIITLSVISSSAASILQGSIIFLPFIAKPHLPTPTPTATVPPPNVQISFIEYNPPGDDVQGEYVRIHNYGGQAADLTNWTLRDKANHVYTFPSYTLGSGSVFVQVWTKSGINSQENLYWGQNQAIWNNDGDCAYLQDSLGQLIDEYCY